MLEKLFEYPGSKIKSYAKILFIIEAIAFLVAGVICLFNEATIILGLSLIIGGIPSSYITNLFLLAFGDLVETSSDSKRINAQILAKLNEKHSVKVPTEVPKKEAVPAAIPVVKANKPAEAASATQPVTAKPVHAEQPCDAVLAYALQFSTAEGMRSHIERRLKFCEDPTSISVYRTILENSDENLRAAIEKHLNS